ncbi:hypothetical protein M2324_002021 [Rhodovulum sulfidophilum]|nr:hypothetical protein [Rhodovulum sulfidophilum]
MGQPAWDTARSCATGAAAAGPPRGDCTRPDDPLGLAKTDVAPLPERSGPPAIHCRSLRPLPAAMQSIPTGRGVVAIRNAAQGNRALSAAPCPAWLCKVDERNSRASLCVRPVIQPPSSGPRPPAGRRYSPHAGPPPTPAPDLPGTAHKTNRIALSSTACSDRTDRDNATKARRGNLHPAAFLNRSGSLPHRPTRPLPDACPRPTSLAKRSIACPDASSPFFLPSC